MSLRVLSSKEVAQVTGASAPLFAMLASGTSCAIQLYNLTKGEGNQIPDIGGMSLTCADFFDNMYQVVAPGVQAAASDVYDLAEYVNGQYQIVSSYSGPAEGYMEQEFWQGAFSDFNADVA